MADVSKIKGTDNTVYNIKDATARAVTDTFNVITLTGTSGTLTTAQFNSLNVNTIIKWQASANDNTILYCINPKEAQLSYLYRGFSSDDEVITITILKATRLWTKTTTTLSTSGHTHGASSITSGTFNVNRIPDLDASKITSGTIAPERLDIAKNLNLFGDYNFLFQQYTRLIEHTNSKVVFSVIADAYSYVGYVLKKNLTGTFTLSFDLEGTTNLMLEYDSEGHNYNNLSTGHKTFTFTATTTSQIAMSFGGIIGDNISISNIMLNRGSSELPYVPYISHSTSAPIVHVGRYVFDLFAGTGHGSAEGHELSFYGTIIRSSFAKVIFIKGTLLLRGSSSGLDDVYSFPLERLTQAVGVYVDKIHYTEDYCVGECQFRSMVDGMDTYTLRSDKYINGWAGQCWVGSNKGLYCERLYDTSGGSHGAWSWSSIGSNSPVMIDIVVPYED